MRIIDADGAVLGRLASYTAKKLLNGEQVVIVNAEKIIISGRKEDIYAKYKQRFDRSNRANPKHGSKFPRVPDMLVRRTVRGMVNYKTTRGAKAYKSLRVVMGVPDTYKDKETEKYSSSSPRRSISVLELSRMLGWTGGE